MSGPAARLARWALVNPFVIGWVAAIFAGLAIDVGSAWQAAGLIYVSVVCVAVAAYRWICDEQSRR